MAQGHKCMTGSPNGCGFGSDLGKCSIYYFYVFSLVLRQSAAFSYTTQHVMPPEFCEKCRADGDELKKTTIKDLLSVNFVNIVYKNLLLISRTLLV